jgi:RNA polymerase sigma-70 factor (ECF subfamily)
VSDAEIGAAVKDAWGQVLAALIKDLRGDFDRAEDCLQDAVTAALPRWREEGLPASPKAWLLTAARRRSIDRFRRRKTRSDREDDVRGDIEDRLRDDEGEEIPDERLRLIFTCCHPALNEEARVALTLKTVAGLTTQEIAAAFLVDERALAQRVVRAKKKIKLSGIPYVVPEGGALKERVPSVLATLYLVFNEGWTSSVGPQLERVDLAAEAIRVTEVLAHLLPREAEVWGLLALMWLHESRRPARRAPDGAYIPLDEQDRALWDERALARGRACINRATLLRAPGPYQVQAAISGTYASAPSAEAVNHRELLGLYDVLAQMVPSPVVELNRAVVLARIAGPRAALERIADIEDALAGYQPLYAAKAALHAEAGDAGDARAAYDEAIERSVDEAERAWLRERRDALTS